MSLKRTVSFSAAAWLLIISGLHAGLNLDLFRARQTSKKTFKVGFLPVTCHLTCPVNHYIQKNLKGEGGFEPIRFNGWPELKEAFLSKYTDATFILAPMAMKLREEGIPIKIVYLGHRDGTALMVHKDSGIFRIEDLRGKKVAVPNRFSNQRLLLFKVLKERGMSFKDIELLEMPPPDMPAALYANAVDAYCTGEPFGAAAQRAGYARVLRMTRDEWRNYICCVLTVRQELIEENRPMVQDLVNQIQGTGLWLDEKPANRVKAVEIASGKDFFNQDPKILQFVMDNPSDRVTYGDLRMIREEFEDLMRLSMEAGTIKHAIPYEKYIDDSFVRATRAASIPL
jgi:NitT/TauT family transport system substrate-binding protein